MQSIGASTQRDQVHEWSNELYWKENQKSTQWDTYNTDTFLNDSKKASWPACHCNCNSKDFGEGCQTPEQKIFPLEVSFIEPLLGSVWAFIFYSSLCCWNAATTAPFWILCPTCLHRSTLTEGHMSAYSDACSKGQTGIKNKHRLHLLLKMCHCQSMADSKIPCEGVDHLCFPQPSQAQLIYLSAVTWPQSSCLLKKKIAANTVW